MQREYLHLNFKKQWNISEKTWMYIGECKSLIKSIDHTPIMPAHYTDLMTVAMQKGAQSTTAIEGNTLSDEEIKNLVNGKKLPESIEYQGIEVRNILDAFTELFEELLANKVQLITPEVLLRFHKMVGKNLGEHFGAIPGRFRETDVIVGTYRCPDYRDVPFLIEQYCSFLKEQFKYEEGKQDFITTFIEAIVAHIYLEWIHPFSDGNGRTGRLVEFYILSRGCNPNITLHILSNHYNATRVEYYRQIDKAYKSNSLTEFIEYAIVGFKDGLEKTLGTIQHSQLVMTWHKYIYDIFNNVEMKQKEVFKRKRRFALEAPTDKTFTIDDVPSLNVELAKLYSKVSQRTLLRDIEELVSLNIFIKENNKYSANIGVLNGMMALSKGQYLNN